MKTYNYNILRSISLFAVLLFLAGMTAEAQTPPYYNYVPTGGSNSFPFNINTTTGKKVQWILPPSVFVLPSAAPSGNGITNLWVYKAASTANTVTYNTLTVKFATVSSTTFFTIGAWYPGAMTTALSATTALTVPATAGWVNIPLTTPYAYDPSQALIIEISQCGYTGTGFSLPQNAVGAAPNYRRMYSDASSLCGVTPLATGGDVSVAGFGVTLTPLGPCTNPPTAGTSTVSAAVVCAGTSVTLNLTGNTGGTGQTYQWQRDIGSGYVNIGAVLSAPILSDNPPSNASYKCIVTCGSSTTSTPVSVTVTSGLPAGTYTINSGVATGGGNFQTFNDAKAALACGISGPVVFNVNASSGPYTEQVSFPVIAGTSAANTITINGNGRTLTFGATLSTAPSTLELNGSDYFTFNDLIVEGTGTTYAFACHLWNGADNNTFNNCTFNAPANATNTTQVPFSISGSQTVATTSGVSGINNVLNGCTMFSGYYNTVLVGNSASPSTGNQVINCNIRDQYFYGMYNLYQNGAILRGNIIERPTRTTLSTFYGVYISTGCTNMLVEKNRIRNPFGADLINTNSAYGVYDLVAAASGTENKIYNNLISDFNCNGLIAGLYLTGANYVKAYHNTISFDQTSSTQATTTYGILSTGSAGIDIRNNILSMTRGGTGTKYCLYYSPVTGKTSNNNDIYMNAAGGTNNFGYNGSTTFPSLATWQAATGFDLNSSEDSPEFTSPGTGNFAPNASGIQDMGTPLGITTDITNASRSLTTPDVGAYEYTLPPCSGTPSPGNTVAVSNAVCSGVSFTLSLQNNTPGSGVTYQWQSSPDGSTWSNAPGLSTKKTYTSSISTATYFQCIVTCTGNPSATSTPIQLTIQPFYNCYCIPTTTNGCLSSDHITNVTFAAASNPINNTTGACLVASYSDYTGSIATANVTPLDFVSVSVSVSNGGTEYAGFWIDYDHSGTFDASEFITLTDADGIAPWIYNGTAIIPLNAASGITRMRARSSYSAVIASNSACATYSYGETEDYLVNIAVLSPCSATPSPGNTVSSANPVCPSASFTLTVQTPPAFSGVTYQWESSPNGTTWTPVSGGTNFFLTTSVTANTYYHCIVTCNNSGGGSATSSSLLVNVVGGPLSGTYTINSATATGGTNFQTFNDLVTRLTCSGVSGPTVINVVSGSGPYNEQVSIPQVTGMSAVNTITVNGNGNTLTYLATLSTAPHTLMLSGADYFTFNNLIVEGTGATYALVCHLWNQSDNNTFTNCTFNAPANGTSSIQVPFSISGSATSPTTTGVSGNNNVVNGCTMFSGYYNTVLYGNSTTPSTGNQIINCNIRDQYLYASYNVYQNGAILRGNTIERPTRTTVSTFYGIYISTSCTNMLIEKNRIRNPFGAATTNTGTAYYIYNLISAATGTENKFYNNLLSDANFNGSAYGMYQTGSNFWKAYHNTIAFNNPGVTGTGVTYGIYSSGTTGGIDIRNNNITINRGGTGAKYGIYFTSNVGRTCNKNNIYMNSAAGIQDVGFYTIDYATLVLWKTANGGTWDQQSVSADPIYVNAGAGNYQPLSYAMNDIGDNLGITTDITGAARSATPDPGAYEYSVLPLPPDCATGFSPMHAATDICSGSLTLSWNPSFTSGFGVPSSYDVYFGTNPSPPLVSPGQPGSTYLASTVPNTVYYWQIVPKNPYGTASGCTINSFTTVTSVATSNCYCSAVYTNTFNSNLQCSLANGCTDNDGIVNFTMNSVSFNSSCSCPDANSFTASPQIPVTAGATVPVSVTSAGAAFAFSEGFNVWIDYNDNASFEDAGELVFTAGPATTTVTGFITIPCTAPVGVHRLRVRDVYATTAFTSCNSQTYGEAEDYLVNIAANTTVASVGTVSLSPTLGCGTLVSPITATLSSYTGLLQWQYETPVGAANWTDIPGVITNPALLAVTVPAGGGLFTAGLRVRVSDCLSNVLYSTPVAYTQDDPSAPTGVSTVERCGPGDVSVSATVPSGETLEWWSAAAGGTQLGSGSPFTYNTSTTTTIYAAHRNPVTGCLGTLRTPQAITIHPIPTTTATNNGPFCVPATTGATATVTLNATGSASPVNGSLSTPYLGGNGQNGNMFDVTALSNIVITGIKQNLNTGYTETVKIYYKMGSYVGSSTNPAAWTLAGTATGVTSIGAGLPTPIPITLNISVPTGQTIAFYVTCTINIGAGTNAYTDGTAQGSVFMSNADLQIKEGIGKQWTATGDFLGAEFPTTGPPVSRKWNGTIDYTLPAATSFTWTPAVSCSIADCSTGTVNLQGSATPYPYTVTITDIYSCSSTGTTEVTINKAPNIVTLQSATLNSGNPIAFPSPPSFLDIPGFTTATTCDKVVNYNVDITGYPDPHETVGAITYSFTGATTGSGNGTGSGSTFGRLIPTGRTTVTINATNVCGNISKVFRVTVTDNVLPIITPIQVSPTNTNGGECSSLVQVTQPSLSNGLYDNCPNVTIVFAGRSDSRTQSEPYYAGTTTVTWQATDASGNTSTATQNVVVNNVKPVILSLTSSAGAVIFVNQSTTFTTTFTDEDGGGTHTVKFFRDKNDASPASIKTIAPSCTQYCSGTRSYSVTSDPITYTTSEVAEPKVEVLDGCNLAADQDPGVTTFQYLAIAVAGTQFTTAGGHFTMPTGGYPSSYEGYDVSLGNVVKKATTGNSYKGQLEMNVHIPNNPVDWRVHTDNGTNQDITWDYLTVGGCTLATFKGAVRINGNTGYKVLVQQADKTANPATSNFIRVKVTTNSGTVMFDTQPGLTEALTSGNGGAAAIVTALTQGSIKVQPANGCVARIEDESADEMLQNIPNPFNGQTEIRFSVPQDGRYTLKVYNYLGEEVATLFNAEATAGSAYSVTFDGSNLGQGIYTYTLHGADMNETRRMSLVR